MRQFLLILCLMLFSITASAYDVELPKVSEEVAEYVNILETPGFTREFSYPDAAFIKVHFKKFNLPRGVTVEVSNPEGTEVYRYSKADKDQFTLHKKDNGVNSFASISISGDKAIVRVIGDTPAVKATEHSLVTDYQIVGFPEEEIVDLYADLFYENTTTESTCGSDQKVPVACIETTFPVEYERRRPVAKIFNGGGSMCTAWRVGELNRLFTNHHCNSTAAAIAASETWFNYELTDCTGSTTTVPVKVAGDQALSADYAYDYMLYTVQNFDSIAAFGWHGLHPFPVDTGERIYRIGHGYGSPKLAAVESDTSLNSSGFCEVDFPSIYARAPDSDIGYWCDSIGGSSGSPVLLASTNNVVALHHYGGCPNSGVKIENIWPMVSDFFGGVIPTSDVGGGPTLQSPTAAFTYTCDTLTCSFDGSDSSDPDGTVDSYFWQFGDGNESNEGPTVEHTYADVGTYTVKLTVRDNDNLPDSVEQTLGVNSPGVNNPPVANFSYVSDNNYNVQFQDESIDWDGTIEDRWWAAKYGLDWDWFSTDNNPTPSLQFPIGGTFTVRLMVWDNVGGNQGRDDVYIHVKVDGPIQNTKPEARLFVEKAAWNKVRISTTSYDPDDGQEIAEYAYYIGLNSGSIPFYYIGPDALQREVVELDVGENRIYHRVTDPYGYNGGRNYYVTTDPQTSVPPEANYSYTADRNVLSFYDRSRDDYVIATWAWDFGDGTTSEEEDPVHEFPAVKATYDVSLTVTDYDGLSDTISTSIYVNPIRIDTMTGATSKGNKGHWNVELKWEGAPGDTVRIKRNGSTVVDTANDGSETFSLKKNAKRDTWEVCTVDEVDCSTPIQLNF